MGGVFNSTVCLGYLAVRAGHSQGHERAAAESPPHHGSCQEHPLAVWSAAAECEAEPSAE